MKTGFRPKLALKIEAPNDGFFGTEPIVGRERRPCENYFAGVNYALLCGCHKGLA
jgi:hypothetical protein